jgi:diphthamide biosynthesis protein 4
LARFKLDDFYKLLNVAADAPHSEIKHAYHRALLRSHPDKSPPSQSQSVDIALLKEAYTTLSSPELRARFDRVVDQSRGQHAHGPRPAQLVSLDDFDEVQDVDPTEWRYSCRCGGMYSISSRQLDDGQHLVACSSCSEVIWVGYEVEDLTV